jgi:hypothetical protein
VLHKHTVYGPSARSPNNNRRLTRVDCFVQAETAAVQAWKGDNETKLPWTKDPLLCKTMRFGTKTAENISSIEGGMEALRYRVLHLRESLSWVYSRTVLSASLRILIENGNRTVGR